jgi:hypothetical protein
MDYAMDHGIDHGIDHGGNKNDSIECILMGALVCRRRQFFVVFDGDHDGFS